MHKSLVIIPTYNEIENIESIITKVFEIYPQYSILVVDDSSPDGTSSAVIELQKTQPNLHLEVRKSKDGLGKAYIHGFKWAIERDFEFIFEMDADFSHNPKDLKRLRQAIIDGADMAIGSRYSEGVNVVNWAMSRVMLSFFASKYVQLITSMPIKDATSGFVCYSRDSLLSLNFDRIEFVGYAFQIEMKYSLWKKGKNLKEVSIIFTDRTKGESKMSKAIVREAIWGIIKLRLFKKLA